MFLVVDLSIIIEYSNRRACAVEANPLIWATYSSRIFIVLFNMSMCILLDNINMYEYV